jgi:hypothetical protein
MPDPGKTAEIWRREAREANIGDLYLVRVESMSTCDPKSINFDAALEFAPDWRNMGPWLTTYLRQGKESKEQPANFDEVLRNHHIHTYDGLVGSMLSKPTPNYKWMRCVTPCWDNTARRQEGACVFIGASPEKYGQWLATTIQTSKERLFGDERVVFINAWNEWAEGNHLEPDIKFGRRFLEATRAALAGEDLLPAVEP